MRTLEHVLDEDAALSDLLVDDELLVIGSDEENHDLSELLVVGESGGCGGDTGTDKDAAANCPLF